MSERRSYFVESFLIYGGTAVYAERWTREEAEEVVETQRHLIEHFGTPRIEAHVIRLYGRNPHLCPHCHAPIAADEHGNVLAHVPGLKATPATDSPAHCPGTGKPGVRYPDTPLT